MMNTSKALRQSLFLPATRKEMEDRGWDAVDVVLVSGDAYVDHPSFGIAIIARILESQGFRVAILSQPRYDKPDDFARFGRPRLFFGVSAGNLDSIVSNYSGNGKVRDRDDYSPHGNPYFGAERARKYRRRPDRAVIVYTSLCKAAFQGVPVVIGGLEASLRRFVHYDYQQEKLRGSILTDSKADLLVYGMGERAVVEVARRLSEGASLSGIRGTCERLSDRELAEENPFHGKDREPVVLPSWDEIQVHREKFLDAELEIDRQARIQEPRSLWQRQQAMWVLQNPPSEPLSVEELDAVYALPYCRAPHPSAGEVPAYGMIRDSITIVRGCVGNCSFCSIARHQGPAIVSRSRASILSEAGLVAGQQGFGGAISDLGGPTANLYGAKCSREKPCSRKDCLYPEVCLHLKLDEEALMELLRDVTALEGVEHAFVSSGLRMELLLKTPRLLSLLIQKHTPGAMKIAPEHSEPHVLRLMHKAGHRVLVDFIALARRLAQEAGKKIQFNPYVISAHPGCRTEDMARLHKKFHALGLTVRQPQDFTPTPGTLSTAMYVTGLDRDTREAIHVARGAQERSRQRAALTTPGQNTRRADRSP